MQAFRSVQLSPVLDTITTGTQAVIDAVYPAPFSAAAPVAPAAPERVAEIAWPDRQQEVPASIDLPQLIQLLHDSGVVIGVRVMPGQPGAAVQTEAHFPMLEVPSSFACP